MKFSARAWLPYEITLFSNSIAWLDYADVAWLPYEITLFSNQHLLFCSWNTAWLPYEITLFSNFGLHFKSKKYAWLPYEITLFSNLNFQTRPLYTRCISYVVNESSSYPHPLYIYSIQKAICFHLPQPLQYRFPDMLPISANRHILLFWNMPCNWSGKISLYVKILW